MPCGRFCSHLERGNSVGGEVAGCLELQGAICHYGDQGLQDARFRLPCHGVVGAVAWNDQHIHGSADLYCRERLDVPNSDWQSRRRGGGSCGRAGGWEGDLRR